MKKFFEQNDQLKEDIKRISPNDLLFYNIVESARKSGIVCPECRNGLGKNGTGIIPTEYNGYPSYYCHKCGTHFDNLDLIAKHFRLDVKSDFPQVLAEGATLLGGSAHLSTNPARNPVRVIVKKESDDVPQDFSTFIEEAFVNIENLPESARRGLSLKTLEHFTCGFAPKWRHPKSPNAPFSARLIIPTSKFHYLARAISPDVLKQFSKQHAGTKEIFNIEALTPDSTVIVVEGEFDCMSIWQVSDGKIPAIAVSGCASYKLLLDWLDKNPDCNIKFIVMFDNDSSENNPGQTNAKKFIEELNSRGFSAVNKVLSDKMDFDANDWLQKNETEFTVQIKKIYSEGKAELESFADKIKAEVVFNEKVASFENSHGKIPDDVLSELKDSVALIKDISIEKITAELLDSEKLSRALGLCSFFGFNNSLVNNFIGLFKEAKNVAQKSDNQDLKFLADFSLDDLRQDIKKSARLVKKAHEDFHKQLAKEQRIQDKKRRDLQHLQHLQENSTRLETLKNEPQSPERDAEIIQLIRENCEWKCNRRGEPVAIKATAANLNLVFDNDPLIQGIVGYDEFFKADVILKKLPWDKGSSRIGQLWSDIDDAYLQDYISTTYTELYYPKRYFDYLNMISHKNSYHPIKDFFLKLPAWDGTPRAATFFINFLGAEDSAYTREVTFTSLLAAVARIYNPGCEYQYMPIFQGNQGIGKSHILKMLGSSWYTELFDSVDDSHALDAIEASWITEIPELHSFTRAGINSIKAFISRSVDKRRRVYARRAEAIKRSNVFFGTTNDPRPLKDFTGARRFPVIKCHNDYCTFKKGLTKGYVNQLWAEVLQKYFEFTKLDGGNFDESHLRFSRDTQKMIETVAEDYTIDDAMVGEILEFLNLPIPYQVIWNLLTKNERQRFCSEHNIFITRDELIRRQLTRKRPAEMDALIEILDRAKRNMENSIVHQGGALKDSFKIYGVELRNSVCAVEIYNECFGYNYDQRKSINRIADVLACNLPEEWTRYGRKKCGVYGDQKSVYVRDISGVVSEPVSPAQEKVKVVQVNLELKNVPKYEDEDKKNAYSYYNHNHDALYKPLYSADSDEEEFLTEKELRDSYGVDGDDSDYDCDNSEHQF